MSTFTLEVKTDNAAFDPKEAEVDRTLEEPPEKYVADPRDRRREGCQNADPQGNVGRRLGNRARVSPGLSRDAGTRCRASRDSPGPLDSFGFGHESRVLS